MPRRCLVNPGAKLGHPGGSTTARCTVIADGDRFLMGTTLLASDSSSGHSVVVVENWIEELKQRVPN